jgi:hypothetical protein
MRPRVTELTPLPDVVEGGWRRSRCQVRERHEGKTVAERTLFVAWPDGAAPPLPEGDADPWVRLELMEAMRKGHDLVVHGQVDRELLHNLDEFCRAWSMWQPRLYRHVDVAVDEVVQRRPSVDGVLASFSGGVDSCYTVLRNLTDKRAFARPKIQVAVLIGGFDIRDPVKYRHSVDECHRTLASAGVRLLPCQTNFRQHSKVNWEHCFALALTGVMSHFRCYGRTLLLASGRPYDEIMVQWGSSPATDHLLGSGDFAVVHHGAEATRIAKCAAISHWPEACRNLRVCWEGRSERGNCGVVTAIRQIRLRGDYAFMEWRHIVRTARAAGIDADWVAAAAARVEEDLATARTPGTA